MGEVSISHFAELCRVERPGLDGFFVPKDAAGDARVVLDERGAGFAEGFEDREGMGEGGGFPFGCGAEEEFERFGVLDGCERGGGVSEGKRGGGSGLEG